MQLELGEPLRELALELLRPGADPRELRRAARRAGLGRRLVVAAVVAAQRAVAVEDERDVAVRAADRVSPQARQCSAGATPAPVQQQDRLAAALGEPPSSASSGAESG